MPIVPADGVAFEFTVPVVIIGAGACGLVAGLSAHDAGAEILILERDERPRGSTSLSAGLIPAANTLFQREKGVDDTPALFAADLAAKAKGQNDPAIVAAVATISGPTIDWLSDTHGVELHLVDGFYYPGHSRLRMHGPKTQSGADLEQFLLAAAETAGIDILTGASVEDLYARPDGTITGVAFRRPDGAVETVGCEALILACNGFGGDSAKVRHYIPEMAEADYCGHASNTGDCVDWGSALGATLDDMGSYQGHGSVAHPHGLPLTWAVITQGGFQVNRDGTRFANEMRGYSEHAEEVIKQPGRFAWDIYDARCERPALGFHDYREIKSLGAVKSADTIEALARITDVPLDALRETFMLVDRYRARAEADPFGRDFSAQPSLAPPYLACRISGALFHTQGGLAIDTDARVLGKDGAPLPNLLAGGGAARGLSGPASWGYLSGNGLLAATMLGRLAGLTAGRLLGTSA